MSMAAGYARPNPGGWLFGRTTDLLLGSGLGYLLSVPVLVYVSLTTGATQLPVLLTVAIGMLLNAPHYGATVLRVYAAREDRQKYIVFSVYTTLALALSLVAASRSVWIATLLITAYLTWSPWHFSGQNYGLMLMFLRRRGVDVDRTTKRLIYASFILSAVLSIMAIHAGNEHFVFAPSTLNASNTPRILKVALPAALGGMLVALATLAYFGSLGVAVWRLRRVASLRDIGPAFILVLTQALWFVIPAIALNWRDTHHGALFFSAIWISAAHSVQYLWVTAYYARSSDRDTSVSRFLLKSLIAGTAVTTLPGLVLAPNLLGFIPWDAGLAATLFSVVNLHHFILDGAIWKLRDGRVARVLLRSSNAAHTPRQASAPSRHAWVPALLWAAAALSLAITPIETYALSAIKNASDARQADVAIGMLRWVGRERVEAEFTIGERLVATGHRDLAIDHYRRSIELFPTARAWGALGVQYRTLGRLDLALAAFESAVELNPDFWGAHLQRAELLLAGSSVSEPEATQEAIESLERVLVISPGSAQAALLLARVLAESGRADESILVLEEALRSDQNSDADSIHRRLESLRRSDGNVTPTLH